MGAGDASHAIAAKKAEAQRNLERISRAITSLQSAGAPVNVQSVARAAGVSPDTVRRSGDLFNEVRRLRDGTDTPNRFNPRTDGKTSAIETSMQVRMLAAQAEVKELRAELGAARAAAHQKLGQGGSTLDRAEADALRRDNSELQVALDDARANLERAREELAVLLAVLTDELTAAREVTRAYVRELTETKEQLVRVERELTSLRSLNG